MFRSRSGYDSETDDGEDSDDYAVPLGIPIVSNEDGRRLVEYKPSNHSINKGRWTKEEVSYFSNMFTVVDIEWSPLTLLYILNNVIGTIYFVIQFTTIVKITIKLLSYCWCLI